MNDIFNEQKDALLSIKHEINLLHQQVDFLLRNEKAVGLLDLDVMMNRTHTIYDQMCSINLGGSPEEIDFNDEEEEPMTEEPEPIAEESEPLVEEPEPEQEEPVEEEETVVEENEDAYFEEDVEEEEDDTPRHCEGGTTEAIQEEPKDDMGFILNFEPTDEKEPSVEEEAPSLYTTGDEIEMTVPPTLADKLQHDSLNDLRSAIGINDKFLFVNELFGGSMEKYNKSIDNLNDLKTLNGALVYMNELRIELQWNSNNEAYKRLLDLVHHKFE